MDNDHVAVNPDYTQDWIFVIPSDYEDCSDQLNELIEICRVLFDAFNHFIIPCKITYTENMYPAGWSISKIWENLDRRTNRDDIELSGEDGIDLDTLVEYLRKEKSGTKYIHMIQFIENSVKVHLESGERYVDRSDGIVEYRGQDPLDADPITDPLTINLSHAPNRDDPEIKSPFLTDIRVKTKSQIWFGDDDINRMNGRRLADFLETLRSALPVEKVIRDTDYDNTDHMEELF